MVSRKSEIQEMQNLAKSGETVTQIIDRIFFTKEGFMRTEFDNLYAALFDKYLNHVAIIKILAERWRWFDKGFGRIGSLCFYYASAFVQEKAKRFCLSFSR